MKLTKIQKLIVESKGKNILVSAGAGTGKTRVLVERFLSLVKTQGVLVNEILALTFTDKAAMEMKSRILAGLKALHLEAARRELESAYISTIHAFAARVLREHPIEAEVDPDFSVIEPEEAEAMKESALDTAIESGCAAGDGTFELLKTYEEHVIRQGVLKIFGAARNQGQPLGTFFTQTKNRLAGIGFREGDLLASLFEQTGEEEFALAWKRFAAQPLMDWKPIEDFREWSRNFNRRGGKKDKALWKDIARLSRKFLGSQLDLLAQSEREKFETLALSFEALYEAAKKERRFLDFDDLQSRVLDLFRRETSPNRKLRERYQRQFKHVMMDELQDTNPLQVQLVELLSSEGNQFYVGDFRQSIYGFRGTSPEHFLAKKREYESNEEKGVCVFLPENFRTEPPLLEFINTLFRKIWAEDGFQFEDLMPGIEASSPPPEKGASWVELLAVPLRTEEKESMNHARLREAAGIAERILRLRDAGVPYGDMVILFQAMTVSGIYEQALKGAGIPYFVVAGRGFYHQSEIRDMMSLLACLENPLSDIPLAATLRSPFFQVKDDTLYWLSHYAKKTDNRNPLFSSLKDLEKINEVSGEEKEKLRTFNKLLEELLEKKDRLRLTELLGQILHKTSFDLAALAHPQGVRRYANLKKLMDLAREYESREVLTLSDFIHMIRGLESREVRESEAPIEAEKGSRAVRLMTIHAAKGLEFPVVFVADLAHERRSFESKTFLAEAGRGYALALIHPETQKKEAPLSWTEMDEALSLREHQEWKRLFYVALTRSRSRLILSGVHKESETVKKSFYEMSSWMDWLMACREALSDKMQISWMEPSMPSGRPALLTAEKKAFQELLRGDPPQAAEDLFENSTEWAGIASQAAPLLKNLEVRARVPARAVDLSVSAYVAFMKDHENYRRSYEIGYPAEVPEKAEEMSPEEELSPADFGTAVHRVLERLDFGNPAQSLKAILPEVFRGLSAVHAKEAGDLVEKFVQSAVFREIQKAKRVYRELPFTLNERHGRVYGVIDLLFQDASGRWHLLDYKTTVGDPSKIREALYDQQISLYGLAVHNLLRIAPHSAIIYFLKNHWEHRSVFPKGFFEKSAQDFRKIQEEVLAFNVL